MRSTDTLRGMPELAVTAIGRDRPGIVASVTGALLELGGNVEDSQMSILGGHFAVMLLVAVPDGTQREEVAERLSEVAQEHELEAISVAEVSEGAARPTPPTHVVTVCGADSPGIVHAVSSALAEAGVNITDLETKLTGSEEAPVYVMVARGRPRRRSAGPRRGDPAQRGRRAGPRGLAARARRWTRSRRLARPLWRRAQSCF